MVHIKKEKKRAQREKIPNLCRLQLRLRPERRPERRPGLTKDTQLAVEPKSPFSKSWALFTRPPCLLGPIQRSSRTEGNSGWTGLAWQGNNSRRGWKKEYVLSDSTESGKWASLLSTERVLIGSINKRLTFNSVARLPSLENRQDKYTESQEENYRAGLLSSNLKAQQPGLGLSLLLTQMKMLGVREVHLRHVHMSLLLTQARTLHSFSSVLFHLCWSIYLSNLEIE